MCRFASCSRASSAFGATVLAAAGFGGCDGGMPASATFHTGGNRPDSSADATAVGDAGVVDASIPTSYAVCPDAMTASFPSIFTQMFATASCGIGQAYDCHSTSGALPRAEGGTGSGLDLSLDAAAVFAELLGADGGGRESVNVGGDAGGVVLRVAPGDAGASLLYIKLALPTPTDPRYGKAMPPTGLVCPAALDAVKAWIDHGAATR